MLFIRHDPFNRCLKFLTILLAAYMLVQIPFQSTIFADDAVLDVYFFYSDTCPHCARQERLMETIDEHNSDVEVHFLEVSRNHKIWQEFREQYTITSNAVPRTFVGERTLLATARAMGHWSTILFIPGLLATAIRLFGQSPTPLAMKCSY